MHVSCLDRQCYMPLKYTLTVVHAVRDHSKKSSSRRGMGRVAVVRTLHFLNASVSFGIIWNHLGQFNFTDLMTDLLIIKIIKRTRYNKVYWGILLAVNYCVGNVSQENIFLDVNVWQDWVQLDQEYWVSQLRWVWPGLFRHCCPLW